MNLIFRVSLTLFIGSRLLNNIVNTSIKSRRSIENNYKNKARAVIRSESLLLINRLLSKKNETNEGEYATIL